MTRVLVTGGAGFIGSHLVRALVGSGHEVRVLARPKTSLERLSDVTSEIEIVHGDVSDPAGVVAALGGWRPDVCAHLAWYADPKTYLKSQRNLDELSASCAFLAYLMEAGIQRFLVTGSCAEYAPSGDRLREDSPAGPATLYAACKLSLQMVAAQLAADYGAQLTWARIFHLYGPFENSERLVPAVIKTLLAREVFLATAGDQLRDYLHVADVASGLCALVDDEVDGVVNICSAAPTTVRQVIETVAEIVGGAELVRFGQRAGSAWDPPVLYGDNTRLIEATGWRRRFELRPGLEDTVRWWQSRAEL